MRLEELEAQNAAALEALRSNPGKVDFREFPYRGYYTVDLFDCPPFVMFTNNDCPRGWDILYARHFEPMSMKIWCRLAPTATGILDIGSHVGVFALAAAALRNDIMIHAFEPNPHAYTRLRMHKVINGFNNIAEHTVAVGNKNTHVNFSWAKKPTLQISSGGGVGLRKTGDSESIIVPMAVLDGTGLAATLGARPLIKVDVEGFEVGTFTGMQEVLALKPDILLESFSQESCDAINAMILPLGYQVYLVKETEGKLERQDRLLARDPRKTDFNQFLTVHPLSI